MKIVVIGGSGLIGSKLVKKLSEKGHEVLAASPKSGVNTITGEGLAQALVGAQVVVDVANSPSFEDKVAWDFFTTSGRNLLGAEAAAGVKHHVALSVVGADRLQESGYFRAKQAQEHLIQSAKIPYTIVRSTQFLEFLEGIIQFSTAGDKTVHLSPAAFQPIFSDDVAAILADVALSVPLNSTLEIAGPERAGLAEFVQRYLNMIGDTSRKVVVDPKSAYSGVVLDDQTLVPSSDNVRIAPTRLEDWVKLKVQQAGEFRKTG